MKKVSKIIAIILTLGFAVSALASCDAVDKLADGGKDLLANVQYDYAVITMPDGTAKEIELDAWGSDGNSPAHYYYIFGTDGEGYITGARNCMFVNKPDVDINVGVLSSIGTMKYSFEAITIRNPDGSITELPGGDKNKGAIHLLKFEDEDGTIYTPHADNFWVKIKVD